MAATAKPNPLDRDWGPEELDFIYELGELIRKRVVSLSNEEKIPPTEAFNRIRQEDLEDEREERNRTYRR